MTLLVVGPEIEYTREFEAGESPAIVPGGSENEPLPANSRRALAPGPPIRCLPAGRTSLLSWLTDGNRLNSAVNNS